MVEVKKLEEIFEQNKGLKPDDLLTFSNVLLDTIKGLDSVVENATDGTAFFEKVAGITIAIKAYFDYLDEKE